jgi:Tfp pilus assembly protein PilX
MNKLNKNKSRRAFSVLFMSVMMMTVTMSITLTYSAVVLGATRQTRENIDSVKAFYAAETAVESFLYQIAVNLREPLLTSCDNNTNIYLHLPSSPVSPMGESCQSTEGSFSVNGVPVALILDKGSNAPGDFRVEAIAQTSGGLSRSVELDFR